MLYAIPDSLIAEYGLRAGVVEIRCDAIGGEELQMSELRGPVIAPGRRGLKLVKLRRILSALKDGKAMDDRVPVYYEAPGCYVILDGAHRYAVALKLDCATLPCRCVSREEAELCYRYPDGQT